MVARMRYYISSMIMLSPSVCSKWRKACQGCRASSPPPWHRELVHVLSIELELVHLVHVEVVGQRVGRAVGCAHALLAVDRGLRMLLLALLVSTVQ